MELSRSGNLNSEVTVSCFTQPDTAFDNIDYQRVNRSMTFAPNQTQGRCQVQIYDDSLYEAEERFFVFVTGRPGALVRSTLQEIPLCVLIAYDPNDGM